MNQISRGILQHRRVIVTLFLLLTAVSAVMILGVRVNFNMMDYLPKSAQSTTALQIMEEEFSQTVPNANVLLYDVTLTEALAYKQRLKEADGVVEVLWLDDMADLRVPAEMAGEQLAQTYYRDGNALIMLTVAKGQEVAAAAAIRQVIGEKNAMAGEALDLAAAQEAAGSEARGALILLIPLVLVILFLSTSSWYEPVLFVAAIGISVLINMGTDLVFFGEISFVTRAISPILQMAVSLDYAIFLLHSFADFRAETDDLSEAMVRAMKRAMPAVAASASTTLFGFLALAFMKFEIGSDMGVNLVKGITLSFVSVMVFLPALTLCTCKLLDKSRHRVWMPSFKNINKLLSKINMPALILVLLIALPCFLGQRKTNFTYGTGDINSSGRGGQDKQAIHELFGESTVMVVLVPRGDVAREALLGGELLNLEHVTGVMSYASMVGNAIPQDFLERSVTSQFYSENYARIILYTDTPSEGAVAFETVRQVTDTVGAYYDTFYTAGQSANLYDMKTVVEQDTSLVNLIAIISIFLMLVLTFRSASLPFLLLFTIEAGIWINLAIPFFTGTQINYIGYLVVSTVQLGATVDYAILLTDHYVQNRKLLPPRAAMDRTMGETFKSILISATVLCVAGFALYFKSSNPIVGIIGRLLGRGTLLSFLMVVCVLPALLRLFDGLIARTTHKANFIKAAGSPEPDVNKGE